VFHTREWARWLKSPLIRSIVTVYRYFADRFDEVRQRFTADRMSLSTGPQVLVRLLVGNLVLSACLAAAGYVLAVGSAGDANPPQILH